MYVEWQDEHKGLKMKNLMFVVVLILVTACSAMDGFGRGPDSAGYVETGASLYDGKKYVRLVPGSLFDADNTPSVFRVGMLWDERYGDQLHLIAAFPLGKVTSTSELSKSTAILKIKIDGKVVILPRVKDSISLKEEHFLGKEYGASIKYKVTRKTIDSMLSSSKVVFRLDAANLHFEGGLHVPAKVKNNYGNVFYTAISGLKRFYTEVWGKQK